MGEFASQFTPCLILVALQFLLALPWLAVLDPKNFRDLAKRASTWVGTAVVVALQTLERLPPERLTLDVACPESYPPFRKSW